MPYSRNAYHSLRGAKGGAGSLAAHLHKGLRVDGEHLPAGVAVPPPARRRLRLQRRHLRPLVRRLLRRRDDVDRGLRAALAALAALAHQQRCEQGGARGRTPHGSVCRPALVVM